ncbi:cytidine deaminase-like [Erpetoichthys calabaricus]|uniref:Cytidine deaminase n=1 Tax=Erpetoichthys calabaricus TaxID=27687 RepID=A0A8C4SCG1_ERPCA|nr:cytidine deaminase-like [Erpetoichthys calabaricus]
MEDPVVKELILKCQQARARAYCPYSKYPVGAALLTKEGKIFQGCNVENASYGLTVCAERTAIQKAISEGYREFCAMAINCDMKNNFIGPCGACRQVLMEFTPHWDLYLVKLDGTCEKTTLKEILPYAFSPLDLEAK